MRKKLIKVYKLHNFANSGEANMYVQIRPLFVCKKAIIVPMYLHIFE